MTRTSGKKNSRLIFTQKNETPIEHKKKNELINKKTEMPTEEMKDILPAGSLKKNIDSYFSKVCIN